MNLSEIIYIGCGGFFGAVSRFYLSGATHKVFGKGFPYGTLAVNALGSFGLGLFSLLIIRRQMLGANLSTAVTIGFFGAFTTFSTFSLETFGLLKEGSYYLFAMNILGNLAICLIMVALGFALGVAIDKAL